jgi:hypothetical protein
MIHISSTLSELQTWFTIDEKLIEKVKQSNVTTENNHTFYCLMKNWENGLYDEDPGGLYNEILYLIEYDNNKKHNYEN